MLTNWLLYMLQFAAISVLTVLLLHGRWTLVLWHMMDIGRKTMTDLKTPIPTGLRSSWLENWRAIQTRTGRRQYGSIWPHMFERFSARKTADSSLALLCAWWGSWQGLARCLAVHVLRPLSSHICYPNSSHHSQPPCCARQMEVKRKSLAHTSFSISDSGSAVVSPSRPRKRPSCGCPRRSSSVDYLPLTVDNLRKLEGATAAAALGRRVTSPRAPPILPSAPGKSRGSTVSSSDDQRSLALLNA